MEVKLNGKRKTEKKVKKGIALKYSKPIVSKIQGDVVMGTCCFVNTYKTQ